MKISEQWLRTWVNPTLTTTELCQQLTMAGLEVDSAKPVAPEFTGVVVGEVVACGQHPNADRLQITQVNIGAEELLSIVCGANNCRQGLKVAVAIVGAVLPEDFKIKKSKLRGEVSEGMLCSESELGLADKSPGIMELPLDAPLGVNVRDYLQLNDQAIDIELTPNRGDCLSVQGIAREVATLNQLPMTAPEILPVAPTIDDTFDVRLEAPAGCPKYLGRVIKGINPTAQSPLWMIEKLRRSGIRTIDPVVDVTNYVLLELGQPMHGFDLNQLQAPIIVRESKPEETLVLLDGTTAKLSSGTLTICDGRGPIALAGIFGGQGTGVSAETVDIFLECAYFSPDAIRGRAREYGLHTEASHRYERGVDPKLQILAMERATQLILAIAGGEPGPVVDTNEADYLPTTKTVSLRRQRISKLLGIEIPVDQVTNYLKQLGFTVMAQEQSWHVEVPSFRFDIEQEIDLIEEVARIYGYDNIPHVPPQANLQFTAATETKRPLHHFKQQLVQRQYQEVINYSFVDPKKQASLMPTIEPLVLPHPISQEMSVMRVNLWAGLLNVAAYNQHRQQQHIKIFEQGLRFIPDAKEALKCQQESVLSGLICGYKEAEHWSGTEQAYDFYDIKGDVEALLPSGTEYQFVPEKNPALHPGQSAAITVDDRIIGWVGALHPQHIERFGVQGKVFLFEVLIDEISTKPIAKSVPISKFPSIRRDLALVVKDSISSSEIISFIKKVGGNQVVDLKLFDVYHGRGIENGYKSIAVGIILQEHTHTLTDEEISQSIDKIVSNLHSKFNAALRE